MKRNIHKNLLGMLKSKGILAISGGLLLVSCGAQMGGYSETDGVYYDPNKDTLPEAEHRHSDYIPTVPLGTQYLTKDDLNDIPVLENEESWSQRVIDEANNKIDEIEKEIDIEIDGQTHNQEKVKQIDKRRDENSKSKDWIVLRFTTKEIKNNLKNCLEKVLNEIKKRDL